MYNNLTYLKAHLEINQDEEREDDFYALSKDMCIVTEFLQSVETQQRASVTPHQRNAMMTAEEWILFLH